MTVPARGFGEAVFLVLAVSLAGVVHVLWLRSHWSKAFGQAVDGGLTLRGRRLFGANKMVRGLLVLPVASALPFASCAALRRASSPGTDVISGACGITGEGPRRVGHPNIPPTPGCSLDPVPGCGLEWSAVSRPSRLQGLFNS